MTEITEYIAVFFRGSYLGKSHCVEKVLSGIPKGTKYMPLPCQFFLCDYLYPYVVIAFDNISTACTE